MKPAHKHIVFLICTTMLLIAIDMALSSKRAIAVEKKPPLHIKVGQQPKKEESQKEQGPSASETPDNQTEKTKQSAHIPLTSCPLVITARNSNHYGLRVNLIRQDRRALQLATALRQEFFQKGRDTQFISALYDASVQTGTSFELLVIKAMMESSMGTLNFNESSSARGTFQYVESTWLNLMSRFGAKAGYPEYAKIISIDPATMAVSIAPENESKRVEILDLRFDPYIAAVMKGLQIEEETAEIRKLKNDGYASITDHYVAHMLGLPLARKFYEMKNAGSKDPLADPNLPAMLAAAQVNRPFFYDENGKAMTAAQSYIEFDTRVKKARKRLYAILRKYSDKRGGCGRFEPIPPYEAAKPAPIAKEAKKKSVFDLTFFGAPQTPAEESEIEVTSAPENEAAENVEDLDENVPILPTKKPQIVVSEESYLPPAYTETAFAKTTIEPEETANTETAAGEEEIAQTPAEEKTPAKEQAMPEKTPEEKPAEITPPPSAP